jgi:hypothetical protein
MLDWVVWVSLLRALLLLLVSCGYASVEDLCRGARLRGMMERMEERFGEE